MRAAHVERETVSNKKYKLTLPDGSTDGGKSQGRRAAPAASPTASAPSDFRTMNRPRRARAARGAARGRRRAAAGRGVSPDAAGAHPDAGAAQRDASAAQRKTCPSTMVLVRAGTFRMGSKDAKNYEFQVEGSPIGLSEVPIHKVTLPAFCMDRTEVTVASYRACVTAGACSPPGSKDKKCNWSQAAKDDSSHRLCELGSGPRLLRVETRSPSDRGTVGVRRAGNRRSPLPLGNRKPEMEIGGRYFAAAGSLRGHGQPHLPRRVAPARQEPIRRPEPQRRCQ